MKRSSKYYALQFIVECKPSHQAFFESIAAFNDDGIAKRYALDCANTAPRGYEYRVMERKSRGFVQIHPKV